MQEVMAEIFSTIVSLAGFHGGKKWWMMGARANGHLRTDLRVCL